MSTRELPRDIMAEQAILGGILLNPTAITTAKKILDPADFYSTPNQLVAGAMWSLDGPVDIVRVVGQLEATGTLEKAGGEAYIIRLLEGIGTAAGMPHYCETVKAMAHRRQIITMAAQAAQDAYDLTRPLEETAAEVMERIRELQGEDCPDILDSAALVRRVFDDVERRSQGGQRNVGILCGIPSIDDYMGGLEPKTLIFIAGRPSMGKTALALTMAENMATAGAAVLYVSLEMSGEAITRRRLAAQSNVFLSRIRSGNIEAGQWGFLVDACNALSDRRLLVIDSPKYKTIETLAPLVEYLATRQPLGAVFVDHIQLMGTRQKYQSRHLEVSAISNALKWLAKDLSLPVVALCQLSRSADKRPPSQQRPRLADLKESGDLEQDADVVLGVYRHTKESDELEIGCIKGRDVGTWELVLTFDRFTQRITA